MERIKWIDASKGFCIVLVVLYHIYGLSYVSPYLCGGFMATFFYLSGYTNHGGEFVSQVSKKGKRLLLPYFFYGILSIILLTGRQIIHGNFYYPIKYFLGLLYSRYSMVPLNSSVFSGDFILLINPPLWFLTTLFLGYVWYYFYINIKSRVQKLLIISLGVVLTFVNNELPYLLPWGVDISFIVFVFIMLGRKSNSSWIELFFSRITFKSVCIFIILLLVYVGVVKYNGHINISCRIYGQCGSLSIFLYFIIGLLETLFIITFFKHLKINFLINVFSFLGKHSLRIMCIHIPLSSVFVVAMQYLEINVSIEIKAVILILVSLFLSVLIDLFYERNSLHFLKKNIFQFI